MIKNNLIFKLFVCQNLWNAVPDSQIAIFFWGGVALVSRLFIFILVDVMYHRRRIHK